MSKYVPNTREQQNEMLQKIGVGSTDDLFSAIPQEVRIKGDLDLPKGLSEMEVLRQMEEMAGKNKVYRSIFRGAGAYRHFIPAMVENVLSNETLQTAYTPYQAEISQGVLQSIFEYQTGICELTGMDVSNASVYDGASAAAEAVAMCVDKKRKKALVSSCIQPQVIETIRTYCFGSGTKVELIPEKNGATDLDALREMIDDDTACVYIQNPNFYGTIEDGQAIGEIIAQSKAKYIMGVNPISLGILKTPAEYGADIAVGEGQPLGLPLCFGGPYIGFMATTEPMKRKLPGRIVGQTTDVDGRTGYVLTLQAREQHIRREKASSNICSNQALCALAVGVYLAAMGPEGLREAAIQSASAAHYMAQQLKDLGFEICYTGDETDFFNEFVTRSEVDTKAILNALEQHDILGGLDLGEGRILWCCTEMNRKADIDEAVAIIKEVL